MSETLTDRIKYISSVQPDHLMSAFASDLNEIVTRAEASEAALQAVTTRAAELEADCANLKMIMSAGDAHIAALTAERDEWKRRFALNEHVSADLRNIRILVKAPDELNTFDAVGKVISERDEARRQLEQARQVCAYWLHDARFIVANTKEHNEAVEMLKRVVNDPH